LREGGRTESTKEPLFALARLTELQVSPNLHFCLLPERQDEQKRQLVANPHFLHLPDCF
jgi:hypothetical protein